MRTEEEYSAAVEEAKLQIEQDIAVRWSDPRGVSMRPRSFSELHDEVDANLYAGFCGPVTFDGGVTADRSRWEIRDMAVVQDRLDLWLQETADEEYHLPPYHLPPRQEAVSVEYEPGMGFARVILEITEDGAYTQHSLTLSLEAFAGLRRLIDLTRLRTGRGGPDGTDLSA